jgi:hypothetical protein
MVTKIFFRPDLKPTRPDQQDLPKPKYNGKGLSPKRAAEMDIYLKEAKEFIKGKQCAVYPELKAVEVHHRKGRLGKLLLDKDWFLPVSRKGHTWIHDNPNAAMEKGFLVSRLSK